MIQLCSSFSGGTEIVQACNSCHVPGFCANIVLAFISEEELFDYVVDGGEGSAIAWMRGSQMWDMASRWGESNPKDAMSLKYRVSTIFRFYIA